MSWLAVTFTTQEINSLIRPLGLGCLAAVNLLSREGCYQPASGAAAPDIGLETWLELSLVTASGPHQVFNSLWKTCCGESDSDRRLQFLRRLLVLCGLRPGLSITQDERGAAWSGTVTRFAHQVFLEGINNRRRQRAGEGPEETQETRKKTERSEWRFVFLGFRSLFPWARSSNLFLSKIHTDRRETAMGGQLRWGKSALVSDPPPRLSLWSV